MGIYRRPWTRCQIGTGFAILGVGLFVLLYIPVIMKNMIYSTFSVESPTAAGTANFIEQSTSDAIVYNSYYVWNVSNPNEIEFEGADPILIEVGPYTYQQRIVRHPRDFAWHANASLEYVEHTQYTFIPSMSVGPESDVVQTVNMGYVGALHQTKGEALNEIVRLAIALEKTTLFMNLTVGELLWGYNNTLLTSLKALGGDVNPFIQLQNKNDFEETVLPAAVYGGGAVADGFVQPDRDDLRQMNMWNGMRENLTYWGTPEANKIQGTDGTCFHPYFTEDEDPYTFVDSLYRSVRMTNCGTIKKDGVKLLCLTLRDDVLLNKDHVPANAGYYSNNTGFIPLPPVLGQPVYISLPHFHRGNTSDPLANKIKFVPDDREDIKYDTRLYVEPFTGQLMDAHKRLQINTLLEPNVTAPGTTPYTFFPIVWVDQAPSVPDSTVSHFKVLVYLPYYGSLVGGSVAIGIGSLMIIIAILRCTVCVSKATKERADMEANYGIDYQPIMGKEGGNGSGGAGSSLATVPRPGSYLN